MECEVQRERPAQRQRPRVALSLALTALALACARPAAPPARPEPTEPAPPAPPEVREPARPCLRFERIVVHKGERRLWASCEGGAVLEVAVALGRAPEGAKRNAGDQRTPEGVYRVVGRPRPSRFHRFLAIDYPSQADADRALAEGRLSRADHQRISAAHRQRVLPPHDTPLGGHIGFHGEGRRWRGESLALDWTEGCIALADSDLDLLIARTRVGTPVTILGADAPPPRFPRPAGGPDAPP